VLSERPLPPTSGDRVNRPDRSYTSIDIAQMRPAGREGAVTAAYSYGRRILIDSTVRDALAENGLQCRHLIQRIRGESNGYD
jgi:hypothetical protein